MADEFYEDEEEYGPPVPKFWKILGKCIKYTAIGLVVFVNALILWRVFFSAIMPASMKTVAGNESLKSAYEEYNSSSEEKKYAFAIYQTDEDNISTDEDWHKKLPDDDERKKTNEFAQFFLTDVVFFPYADQAQIVLRYNRSALSHLQKDFGLATVPQMGDDVFDVTLLVRYKPEGEENEKVIRVKPTLTAKDTTSLYVYNQLSFEKMPEFESIISIAAEIYYKEEVDYTALPYASINVYDKLLSTRDYNLDKKDIAAITGAN